MSSKKRRVLSENEGASDQEVTYKVTESRLDSKKRKSSTGKVLTAKKPKKEEREEQRKKKEERKMKEGKETVLVESLMVLYEKARGKRMKQARRQEVMREIYQKTKGNISSLAMKHECSRVIGLLLWYGNEEQSRGTWEELKPNVVRLSKDKYGKHVIHRSLNNKWVKSQVIAELQPHVTLLIKHKQASYVVGEAYMQCKADQKRKLISEFFSTEMAVFGGDDKRAGPLQLCDVLKARPESRSSILDTLEKTMQTIIAKGILDMPLVHHLMLELFENTSDAGRRDLIDSLHILIPSFLHTRDGAELGARIIGLASAKQRKKILKSFKGLVDDIVMHDCGYIVAARALHSVDDTVLLRKDLLNELLNKEDKSLLEVLSHPYGRLPLLFVMSNYSSSYLSDAQRSLEPMYWTSTDESGEQVKSSTSKKDPEKRRHELLRTIIPRLLKAFGSLDAVKSALGNPYARVSLLELVVCSSEASAPLECADARAALIDLIISVFSNEETSDIWFQNWNACMTMKQLILRDAKCADQFASEMEGKLYPLTQYKFSAYIVLAILQGENVSHSAKKSAKKELKKRKKDLANSKDKANELIIAELEK